MFVFEMKRQKQKKCAKKRTKWTNAPYFFQMQAVTRNTNSTFFYLGFLSHDIHIFQGSKGRGRPILIPLYNFHLLHKHLCISWAITAESSPMHMNSGQSQTENRWFPNANC